MTARAKNTVEASPKARRVTTTKSRQCPESLVDSTRCCQRPKRPSAAAQAYFAAARAVEKMELNSYNHDPSKVKSLAKFDHNEICVGKLLGRGGFSNVYEVKGFKHPGPLKESAAVSVDVRREHEARAFLSDHAVRETTGDARYAIKFLQARTACDPERFRLGAADLAIEANILSNLDHPHIIKIRGLARAGIMGYASGRFDGYFLIIDRLYDTLRQRIQLWSKVERKHNGMIRGQVLDWTGAKRRERLGNRLKVAYDLAGALQYLHDKNIIYRDLKPENIGFDVRGDVKLFDFGTAREIFSHPAPKNEVESDPLSSENGLTTEGETVFDLTGLTGTRRYMAPEVARSDPYNLKADVYSFGVVLWEILSLEKAYGCLRRQAHFDLVVCGSVRPTIDKHWEVGIRSLMERCWSAVLSERPSMKCAYKILREEVVRLRGGDSRGLDHNHRRSTYVQPMPRETPEARPSHGACEHEDENWMV